MRMLRLRWTLAGLLLLAGCSALAHRQTAEENQSAPVPTAQPPQEGGTILKTGALDLGSGVGKNVLWLQGDGQGGFFVTD